MSIVAVDFSRNDIEITIGDEAAKEGVALIRITEGDDVVGNGIFLTKNQLRELVDAAIEYLNPNSDMVPEGVSDTGSFG